MRRILKNTLFLLSAMALLSSKDPLTAFAAPNNEQASRLIPEEYMPHADAFTIAASNLNGQIEEKPYANMAIADVTDFVNIRSNPGTDAEIVGRIYDDAVAEIIRYSSADDSWIEVVSGEVTGFVKAEFFLTGTAASERMEEMLQNNTEIKYARTIEEIRAEIAAYEEAQRQKELEKQQRRQSAAADASTDSELRQAIVENALQYLGNAYVHGGNSLTTGTDCSGFTSLLFAEYGYSLSRTPSGQLSSAGKSIEYSEVQPGDIICYTSNGKTCTHVALYIGEGQIIHAANSKRGVVINDADYSTIIGVKNVIDQ